jgi:hypothetical protein
LVLVAILVFLTVIQVVGTLGTGNSGIDSTQVTTSS